MSSHNDYIRIPAAGERAQRTGAARLIWMAILTIAVIGATFALSCVTPFAALAVALAGTAGLRASLPVVTLVWLANQVIGFVFFHFPLTANTFLWAAAIGAAALVTTIAASIVMKYAASAPLPLRLGIALLLSFIIYEMTLLPAGIVLNGLETFRPSSLAQLGWINAAALIGLVLLNELAAALLKPWLGRMPLVARAVT